MTESTNVGRPEEQPEKDEGRNDDDMGVTVEFPGLILRLAGETTSANHQWRMTPTISSRDARVAEALLMQALEDVRNMGGLNNYPTHAGLQIPDLRNEHF